MLSWLGEMAVYENFNEDKITLVFTEEKWMTEFFKDLLNTNAFSLNLEEQPEPYVAYAFVARFHGGPGTVPFQAVVSQTVSMRGQFDSRFDLWGWDEQSEERLVAVLKGARAKDFPLKMKAERASRIATPQARRILALSPEEKAKVAAKANRAERPILAQDPSSVVLMALLDNPRLDQDDLLTILRSGYADPEVLQKIASERKWTAGSVVRSALAQNQRTPPVIAIKMLETLPPSELMVLSRPGVLHEDLRKIALAMMNRDN